MYKNTQNYILYIVEKQLNNKFKYEMKGFKNN